MPPRVPVPVELTSRPCLLAEARQLGVPAKVVRGRRFRQLFRGSTFTSTGQTPWWCGWRRCAFGCRMVWCSATTPRRNFVTYPCRPLPACHRPALFTATGHSWRRHPPGVRKHSTLCGRGAGCHVTEQTFLDLAGRLALVDLTILGDSMVRRGFTDTTTLRMATDTSPARRGVAVARRAAQLVRPRVDSPMETRVRLLLVLAGLPCPEPGGEVWDDAGQWLATVDLQYREQRIAIEYDGGIHRTHKWKRRRDISTRELLRDHGWEIVVLTASDVFTRPQRTLWRVQDKLRARGHPGAPADLEPEWETHFVPRLLASA